MQIRNKTAPVVEGGILAAIAIVFALVSVYIPVLGVIVNIIWPVPFLLLGVRHGFKASLLCLISAGAVITILISPIQALSVVVGFGFIGIALGYALYNQWSPFKAMAIGTVASFLSKMAVLLIGFYVMGFNPITTQLDAMNSAVDEVMNIYRGWGMTEAALVEMRAAFVQTLSLIKYVMPAGFFLTAVLDTFINYVVAKKILSRLGTYVPAIPPFSEWSISPTVAWVYMGSLLAVSFLHQQPEQILYHIAVNLQLLSMMALLIQGLATISFFFKQKNWPKFLKTIIGFLTFTNNFVLQVVVAIGAFDSFLKLRKLNTPTQK